MDIRRHNFPTFCQQDPERTRQSPLLTVLKPQLHCVLLNIVIVFSRPGELNHLLEMGHLVSQWQFCDQEGGY